MIQFVSASCRAWRDQEAIITGFISWDSKIGGKWLEILKEIAPSIDRVALLHNPQTYTGQQNNSISAGATALGLTISALPFRDAAELENEEWAISRDKPAGVFSCFQTPAQSCTVISS